MYIYICIYIHICIYRKIRIFLSVGDGKTDIHSNAESRNSFERRDSFDSENMNKISSNVVSTGENVLDAWLPSYGDVVWVQTHSTFPFWPACVMDPTLLPIGKDSYLKRYI
jgi:hypothetical protein